MTELVIDDVGDARGVLASGIAEEEVQVVARRKRVAAAGFVDVDVERLIEPTRGGWIDHAIALLRGARIDKRRDLRIDLFVARRAPYRCAVRLRRQHGSRGRAG